MNKREFEYPPSQIEDFRFQFSFYGRKFDFSNHTLRRTFGRKQWKLGTPIETISEVLGHESVDVTKNYLGLC